MGTRNSKKNKEGVYGPPLKRMVVPFRLREDLIPLVEQVARRTGRTRSKYVEDVVTAAVKRAVRRAA